MKHCRNECIGYRGISLLETLKKYNNKAINLSDTEDLVTVMTCNEVIDPKKPDTFFDKA